MCINMKTDVSFEVLGKIRMGLMPQQPQLDWSSPDRLSMLFTGFEGAKDIKWALVQQQPRLYQECSHM